MSVRIARCNDSLIFLDDLMTACQTVTCCLINTGINNCFLFDWTSPDSYYP